MGRLSANILVVLRITSLVIAGNCQDSHASQWSRHRRDGRVSCTGNWSTFAGSRGESIFQRRVSRPEDSSFRRFWSLFEFIYRGLLRNEGVLAFWKGLAFAYGRELSYTSIKLGAYAPVRDALGAGKDAPFYLKFLSGAITGGVGSAMGNPVSSNE